MNVSDLVSFYVAEVELDDLVADHRGRLNEGDVPLLVVPDDQVTSDWRSAVGSAALVELVRARDARVSSAAQVLLDAAAALLATAALA